MRNYINAAILASIVAFSGCGASQGVEVGASTGYEGKEIETYLVGAHVPVTTAEEKLKDAGFEIVTSYESVKEGTTIVFTNESLKKEAAKPTRGHAAVLRLFIDDKEKTISFTNPVYFGKAFMQADYNHAVYADALASITKAFPNLAPSADKMKYDDLEGYHFMVGMPYYQDVDVNGEGAATDALVAKAEGYKDGKFLVFKLKLSDTSYLVGYDLSSRTKKFVEKIGRANAAILPYTVAIENNKASSMDAKFYIALSYPLLTMTEFTTIATVPGAISKELEKPFK